MRDTFPGYYRPTAEDFEQFWDSGIFAFDANVLLSLYRFSLPAREQLLEILTAMKDRLFVPHRALFEFERGRIGVIDEQRKLYNRVLDQIETSKRNILASVRPNSVLDHAKLSQDLDEQLKPVVDRVAKLQTDHPDPLQSDDWLGPDVVRDALSALFTGNVGKPWPEDIPKAGAKRYAARVPPGYADEKKPEPDRYGDLVLWLELIEHAKVQKRPIVFVTGDQKQDWWLSQNGGTIGPRPELIQEMADTANVSFYMYGLETFIGEASERFAIETSEETLEEARNASSGWITQLANRTFSDLFSPVPQLSMTNDQDYGEAFSRYITNTGPSVGIAAASTFVLRDMAVLTLDVRTVSLHDNMVVCDVTTPSGETARSTNGASDGKRVAVRFPNDFEPTFPFVPGTYTVVWADVPADGSPLAPLASSTFVVGSALD